MLEPRRSRDNYSRDELIRVAIMATSGATANDIATALRTTPGAVVQLCLRHGIALLEKHEEETIIRMRVLRQHFDSASRLSAQKNRDPVWFLSRMVRAVLSDKELTAKVVDRVFK